MKKSLLMQITAYLLMLLLLVGTEASATTYTRANNTDNLNLSTAWVGGIIPGSADIALWNGTVTAANTSLLGADTSWAGISITSPGGAVNISAGNTLTLGASGITSTGTQVLTLNGSLILAGNQTWQFSGNAKITSPTIDTGGHTLTVTTGATPSISGNLTGAGGLTLAGGGNLYMQGNSTYSGTTTLTNGSLYLGTNSAGSISPSGLVTGTSNGRLFIYQSSDSTVGNTMTGDIQLFKVGAGYTAILSGSNSYTGLTTIKSGNFSVSSLNSVNGGTPFSSTSSLGAPTTVANGTINMGNDTSYGGQSGVGGLIYTGTGETTDRVVNLLGLRNGATLDQSGTTGLLKFTSNVTATGIGSKTLTLQGSTGGVGEIGGAIVNNSTVGSTIVMANLLAAGATSLTLASVNGVSIGASIAGTGIAVGTTVTGINTSTNVVNLSAATTGTVGNVDYNGVYTQSVTVAGVVNQTSLTKAGTGTWTLSNANSYTGPTTVTSGTLVVSGGGSIGNGAVAVNAGALIVNGTAGSGGVTVANGAALRGAGSIAGSVTVNGTLAPGSSIESLASGTLTFNTGSTFGYEVDFTAPAATQADLQVVNGNLNLTGPVNLTLDNLHAGTFADNTKLTLINYSGTWNGGLFTYGVTLLNDEDVFTFNSQSWRIDYNATVGGFNFDGDFVGSKFVNITAVPEPAAWIMATFGLTTVVVFRRRRRSTKA